MDNANKNQTKILLHACCGPCSLEPTRILEDQGFHPTIFYANSNIHPQEEYNHRLATLQAWAADENIPVVEGEYDIENWEETAGRIGQAALSGNQSALDIDPEKRKARCRACYRLRFQEAAEYAADHGFQTIGTTLSVSPYQYTDIIEEELDRAAAEHGLRAHFEDYRSAYPQATERSKQLGMYRQNFCGCRFSDQEAQEERRIRKEQRKREKEQHRAAHAAEREEQQRKTREKKAQRVEYDRKQARKKAVLKALRDQQKNQPDSNRQ